jgi:hypothetical protein
MWNPIALHEYVARKLVLSTSEIFVISSRHCGSTAIDIQLFPPLTNNKVSNRPECAVNLVMFSHEGGEAEGESEASGRS